MRSKANMDTFQLAFAVRVFLAIDKIVIITATDE